LTKLRNDELPSVKAADLVNYAVLASVYTTIRTNIPYNQWPWVKCGLQICGTFSGWPCRCWQNPNPKHNPNGDPNP